MISFEEIRKIFIENDGIARTSDIIGKGFHNRHINTFINEGKIIRLKRGVYQWIEGGEKEEVEILFRLFPEAIICMDSALYYHGYTDRTPGCWHIAVDRDENKRKYRIDFPVVKIYFVKAQYLEIGVESGCINGTRVKVFDKERIICDVIRYSNKLDKELVNKAIQSYLKDPEKNISRLVNYAKRLRAYKKVQHWMGVWL